MLLGPVVVVLYGLVAANPGVGLIPEQGSSYTTVEQCEANVSTAVSQYNMKHKLEDKQVVGLCLELKMR